MSTKKVLLIIASFLLLGIVSWYIYTVFTTGKIDVSSSDPKSTITISDSSNNQIAQKLGHISKRVRPGQYNVIITDGVRVSAIGTNVQANKTNSYTVTLQGVKPIQVIDSQPAENLVIGTKNAVYRDPEASTLNTLSLNKLIIAQSNKLDNVTSLSWQKGAGLVSSGDSGSVKSLIDNNGENMTNIFAESLGIDSSTISYSNGSYAGRLVKDKNQIVLVTGTQVVANAPIKSDEQNATTAGGSVSKTIGRTTDSNGILNYSGMGAIVYYSPSNTESSTAKLPDNYLFNIQTGKQTRSKIEIENAQLSPTGKYVAFSGPKLSGVMNLGGDVTAYIPPRAANFTWIDDRSFYFSIDSDIFLFNLNKSVADKVVGAGEGYNITSITMHNDQFIATSKSSDGDYRTFTTQQKADPNLDNIFKILPFRNNKFSMNYVGYQKPTIIIQSMAILNRPDDPAQIQRYQTDSQKYYQEAKDWLASRGIDISKITFVYQ